MTNTSRTAIVGLFEDQQSAQQAVTELIQNGFSKDQVHLSSSTDYGWQAASGGAALTGRAPAEQHGGGFMGWLNSLFGTDEYADDTSRYAEAVQRGSYVVAVETEEDKRDRAADILNSRGAIDIDQHAAKHGYGNQTDAARPNRGAVNDKGGVNAIPIVQEDLQVDKRSVQRGGVRVYSRVTEQPVEEDVHLREEKVTVERRAVNRPLTDADRAGLRDQTVEVKEMAEEAVISKQARVVEEVVIGKQSTDRTQKVRDTVRRTEVDVENLGTGAASDTLMGTGTTGYADDFRKDFQTRYGTTGRSYDSYAPAYDFGSRMAGDSRYKGSNWNDVESTLKTDYLRNNPNSTWDEAKGAVRYGWEKVTGKR